MSSLNYLNPQKVIKSDWFLYYLIVDLEWAGYVIPYEDGRSIANVEKSCGIGSEGKL